jgi:GT2 family glycosyltransferase
VLDSPTLNVAGSVELNVLDVSVIIVTLNRPDCVKRCLDRLIAQRPAARQLIVVDASANSLTKDVVSSFPGVLYLRNDNGFGRMTASRNIGLKKATGRIIAFVDDDAFAHDDWLASLFSTYTNPSIGAVGGRALNNQPGEESLGVDRIGRITDCGKLEGNFAANPGRTIEVEHIMGCNMSYRRETLAELGGFREDYPGISGLCEDTDMCLRVTQLGYKILFNPAAAVDHIGAPQAVGRRFDYRWVYFCTRNQTCLLIRNRGLFQPVFLRYLTKLTVESAAAFLKKIGSASLGLSATAYGAVSGLAAGLLLTVSKGRDPVRRDPEGESLSESLRAKHQS